MPAPAEGCRLQRSMTSDEQSMSVVFVTMAAMTELQIGSFGPDVKL